MIAALPVSYALDRGIYFGTNQRLLPEEKGRKLLVQKTCWYLFITGFAEKPAHGGLFGSDPTLGGVQAVDQANKLYCRVFGEE